MSPIEAAKQLELPENATPEQIEVRFNELRAKFEDKIVKAPTPGLKAKYRESLDEITAAFETLILAADSSTLPVLKKDAGDPRSKSGGAVTPPRNPSTQAPVPSPSSAGKSGGREFAVVAVIAIAVLGAGGWWVMKSRAQNNEKARIAAEARAEAERKAAAEKADTERRTEEARLAAEAKRQALEEEKARLAAAEKAAQERIEKLTGQVRSDLAAGKIEWEAIEREERNAERRLSELKSDLRSLRDPAPGKLAEAQTLVAAQQDYYNWLSGTIARHPARVARSRAEELLSARQPDAAMAAVREFGSALRQLESEIPRQRESLLDLNGELTIKTHPDATWTLTDAFGRTRTGRGVVQFNDVAVGAAEVTLTRTRWPERKESVVVRSTRPATLEAEFVGTDVLVTTVPAGARAFDAEGKDLGSTPLQLKELPPGNYRFRFKLAGHYDQTAAIVVPGSGAELDPVKLRVRATWPVKPQWRVPAHFIYESSYSFVTDGNRSTGAFVKNAAAYYSQSSSGAHEEFKFSLPDTTGAWTRLERRVVRSQNAQVPAGLTIRYDRQSDGKWTGAFLAGEMNDPNFRNAYLNFAYDPTWGNSWIDQAWPPDGTPVGGTWKVDGNVMIGAIGQLGYKNDITGKLLAFDREANADWVTLQFTATFLEKGKVELSASGTCTVRINLGDGYIASVAGSNISSSTTKSLIGQIGTDTRGNFSYKMIVP
jgi:hypothetical protein